MLTSLALALWCGSAAGQTPVIFAEGSAEEALSLVTTRTGLPEAQLRGVPLSTLLAAEPALLGPGVLRRCAADPVSSEHVRAEVARSEAAALQGAGDAARRRDRVVAQLGCLNQVVDGSVAARVFVRRGAALATQGDPSGARAEFVTALSLHPDVAWPEDLGDVERGAYDTLQEQGLGATATLSLLPAATPGGPWVDGREVAGTVRVAPGLHLVQFTTAQGIESAWVPVAGDATLVLPRAFRATIMNDMGTPQGNAALAGLLGASFPDRAASYVTHQQGLWMVRRKERDVVVDELAPRVLPEPESLTPREQRRRARKRRKAAP